ncbi:MAG: peptidylprolyl isomerase [Saprospiraceae bacterium]
MKELIILICIFSNLSFISTKLNAQSLETATAALNEIDSFKQLEQLKTKHLDWSISSDKTLVSDSIKFSKITKAKIGDIIQMQYAPNAPTFVLKIISIEEEELCKAKYIYLDGSKYSKPEIDSLRTKIIQQYQEGENFETLVNKYTMDGSPNGDLPWFYKGMMVDEFYQGVRDKSKGEIFTIDVEGNNWFYVVLKNEDNKIEKAVNAIRIRYEE